MRAQSTPPQKAVGCGGPREGLTGTQQRVERNCRKKRSGKVGVRPQTVHKRLREQWFLPKGRSCRHAQAKEAFGAETLEPQEGRRHTEEGEEEGGSWGSHTAPLFHNNLEIPSTLTSSGYCSPPGRKESPSLPDGPETEKQRSQATWPPSPSEPQTQKETPFLIWT